MYVNGSDAGIPLGLGMALTQNSAALAYFAGLSEQRRQEIIEQTHTIGSTKEMHAFVDNLVRKQ